MSNITETRTYEDGSRKLLAQVQDNGCVRFTVCEGSLYAALSSTVLRQLADLADAANVSVRSA
jgi:hypothetical protein